MSTDIDFTEYADDNTIYLQTRIIIKTFLLVSINHYVANAGKCHLLMSPYI